MKTSELKELAQKKGFRIEDENVSLSVLSSDVHPTDLLAVWKRYAEVSNTEPSSFSIYYSNELGDELVDAIINYSRTPIAEREEQYLNVDIPLSAWKELNKETAIDRTSRREATIRFGSDNGFGAMLDVLSEIQDRFLEIKDACDEAERQDTSH